MFEKVNPAHPDKIADRISGAVVDLCYTKSVNPKVACEVLIGHGECNIQVETSEQISSEDYGVPQNRERIFLWSMLNEDKDVNYYFPQPMPLTKTLKDVLEDEVDTRFYLNPERVQEFVRDNIDKVTQYANDGIGEIEPMPEKLREWVENYDKKSITTDK